MRRSVVSMSRTGTLALVTLLSVSCANASRSQTISQELAAERWESCRHISGIELKEIRPNGEIHVWTPGRAQRDGEACLQRAAAEQAGSGRAAVVVKDRNVVNSADANPLIDAGNAYAAKGDQDRAIQAYDQAIRANPRYAIAFYNRGTAYPRSRRTRYSDTG